MASDVTFITGNEQKAKYLERYFGSEVRHQEVVLDEIQSLDLREVVEHKVRQAYAAVGSPVLVEDVALEFLALGRLPGTFIKFYVDEVPFETICRTLDGLTREAIARCVFGYWDGTSDVEFFEGSLRGEVAQHPAGENGYGWDKIFIPEGYGVTRAQMSEADDAATYRMLKPLDKVRDFLVR